MKLQKLDDLLLNLVVVFEARRIKVTGYSSGRGPRSKREISRSAQSHLTTATKDGAQTERYFVCIHSQKEWATLYK